MHFSAPSVWGGWSWEKSDLLIATNYRLREQFTGKTPKDIEAFSNKDRDKYKEFLDLDQYLRTYILTALDVSSLLHEEIVKREEEDLKLNEKCAKLNLL